MFKIILCLYLCLNSLFVFAEGAVNCNNSIIEVGDTRTELLMKCGAPVSTEDKMESVVNENGFKQRVKTGDVLTIDQGKGRFMLFVTIENGIITHVEDGPRND